MKPLPPKVPHYLTPYKVGDGPRLPNRMIFLDVQHFSGQAANNEPIELRFFAGATTVLVVRKHHQIVRREEAIHTTQEGLLDWISGHLNRRVSTWLFGCDMGKALTLAGLWIALEGNWAKVINYIINDPPIYLLLKHRLGAMHVCDTANYFRQPIEKIIATAGNFRPEAFGGNKKLPPMVERSAINCCAIERLFTRLVNRLADYQLCSWKPTAAGLAFNAFRSNFIQFTADNPGVAKYVDHGSKAKSVTPTIYIHAHTECTDHERRALFGGKVECKYIGVVESEVFYLDVNSMFPFAMQHHQYPTRLREHQRYETIQPFPSWLLDYGCIARVSLRAKKRAYPLRVGHEVKYAFGRFDTTLCGPELTHAYNDGEILGCWEYSAYDMSSPFAAFVEYFYRWRLDAKESGDSCDDALAKLMMNSLYGKFQQRNREWRFVDGVRPRTGNGFGMWSDASVTPAKRYRMVQWLVQEQGPYAEWIHSFPAISAYITSYSRHYLDYLLRVCGDKQVYYIDTDSLHCTYTAYERLRRVGLLHKTALGKLKVQASSNDVVFYGPRDYRYGSKPTIAGIKANALEMVPRTWEQTHFQSLGQMLAGKTSDVIQVGMNRINKAPIPFSAVAGPDGWVLPITIGENNGETMDS